MSFQISTRGNAADLIATATGADVGNGREAAVVAVVTKALEDIAQALGGYAVLHASGSVKATADSRFGGDSVVLQVNTILPPNPPVPDAGLAAALGSPENFPPEASTSTAQTADHADNAPQEPVPQPLQPEPVAVPVAENLAVEPVPEAPAEAPAEPTVGPTPDQASGQEIPAVNSEQPSEAVALTETPVEQTPEPQPEVAPAVEQPVEAPPVAPEPQPEPVVEAAPEQQPPAAA